jgi:hypothetical protein
MATLSASDIAGVIKYYNTGGPSPIAPITDENAVKAIAIALAESGGNPEAVGGPNSNGTRDWGLWQINDIHNPTERQKHSAAANWLYAWRIAGLGTNWRPWATFNSGKYRDHMDAARSAWGAATPKTIGAEIAPGEPLEGKTITKLEGPLAFLNPLLDQNVWFRVGMAVGGVVLILLVAAALMKNVTPIGKIASLIKTPKAAV